MLHGCSRYLVEIGTRRQKMYSMLYYHFACVRDSGFRAVENKCGQPNNPSGTIFGDWNKGNARCLSSDYAATIKRRDLCHPSMKSNWVHASWYTTFESPQPLSVEIRLDSPVYCLSVCFNLKRTSTILLVKRMFIAIFNSERARVANPISNGRQIIVKV